MGGFTMVVRVAVVRSRVRDRNALFAELSEAVRPDSAASVLVVVGFEGMKEYLRESSEPEADELLGRLGERLVESIGEGGVVFASRRGEFCTLCEGGLAAIRSLLVMLPSRARRDRASGGDQVLAGHRGASRRGHHPDLRARARRPSHPRPKRRHPREGQVTCTLRSSTWPAEPRRASGAPADSFVKRSGSCATS